jgi:hypothetical protein
MMYSLVDGISTSGQPSAPIFKVENAVTFIVYFMTPSVYRLYSVEWYVR